MENVIDFCAHLAGAIREGSKTATWKPLSAAELAEEEPKSSLGGVGDTLWVREPWGRANDGSVIYVGEFASLNFREARSQPPDFRQNFAPLTRDNAGLFLEITEIMLVNLHAITEEQAQEAGMVPADGRTHRQEFEHQWRTAYRGPQAWEKNPRCWCIHFTRLGGRS